MKDICSLKKIYFQDLLKGIFSTHFFAGKEVNPSIEYATIKFYATTTLI